MSTQVFLILVNFCLLALSIWFLMKRKTKAANSDMEALPPGPRKLPLIGNLHQLGTLPHKALRNLSRKYGPLMYLQLGSVPTVVISSAEVAEEIFKNHDLAFWNRASSYALNKLSYNYSDIAFSPCHKYWRDAKKIVTLELLGARKVQSFQNARKEEVQIMIEAVARSSEPIDIGELMNSTACNLISRVAFSEKYEGELFNEMIKETANLLGAFCLADYFPCMGWLNKYNGLNARLEKNFREQSMLYDEVIEKHRARKRSMDEHDDLVDILLQMQDSSKHSTPFTNEQIKGVIWDMFTAGSDTTSVTVEWTMAELMKNPDTMKKAVDEVREAMDGKAVVEEIDLPNLPYLKSTIKETFRLHPGLPLLVPRETLQSVTIKGYKIPAKTRVYINAIAIATDPKYWENPDEYRPERFLDTSIDYIGLDFQYIPFGSGRRICPGIHFSTVLVELVVANLLLNFNWKMPDGENLNMDELFGLTVHKKIPLRLVAIPV